MNNTIPDYNNQIDYFDGMILSLIEQYGIDMKYTNRGYPRTETMREIQLWNHDTLEDFKDYIFVLLHDKKHLSAEQANGVLGQVYAVRELQEI